MRSRTPQFALMTALRPAIQQAAFRLAEQAAAEIGAQLAGYSVAVLLEDGEPSLLVREDSTCSLPNPGGPFGPDHSAPSRLAQRRARGRGRRDRRLRQRLRCQSPRERAASAGASRRITETFET